MEFDNTLCFRTLPRRWLELYGIQGASTALSPSFPTGHFYLIEHGGNGRTDGDHAVSCLHQISRKKRVVEQDGEDKSFLRRDELVIFHDVEFRTMA